MGYVTQIWIQKHLKESIVLLFNALVLIPTNSFELDSLVTKCVAQVTMASVIIRGLGDSEQPECIIISSGQLVLSWHRINISSAVSSHPHLHNWLLIAPRHRPSSFIQTRALLRMWVGVGRCDYNIHINWDFPQAQDILTIKAAAMFGFCSQRIESDQIMRAGWHTYLASEASEI